MTEIWKRVYKANIVGILKELADKKYQLQAWLNADHKDGMTISFDEGVCMLFDDCVVKHYLEQGEVIFDKQCTQALRELHAATTLAVKEYRDEEEIINDPLMDVVREKAARALYLIQVSTYEGSTVDIAIPGQSYSGEVVR